MTETFLLHLIYPLFSYKICSSRSPGQDGSIISMKRSLQQLAETKHMKRETRKEHNHYSSLRVFWYQICITQSCDLLFQWWLAIIKYVRIYFILSWEKNGKLIYLKDDIYPSFKLLDRFLTKSVHFSWCLCLYSVLENLQPNNNTLPLFLTL